MKSKITILMIILTLTSYGQTCDKYVKACEETVKAQDQAIDNLKKSVKVLKEEVEEQQKKPSTLLVLLTGVLLGVIVTTQVKK